MKYAIIKVINGNYSIHSEGITDIASAKTQYHSLCQVLWNAPDVITGCVAIVNESLEVLSDINPVDPIHSTVRYQEFISHEVTEPTET